MKFRILLVLLACMCVNRSFAKKMKSKASAVEADLVDDITNVFMNQRDASLKIDKRSASRYTVKDICTFPEDPNVVIEYNNTKVDAIQPSCMPRPVPLPINVPIHSVIYPNYVILHRCLGGHFSRLQKCAASKKERIFVRYMELSSYTYQDAVMYNHTECTGNCIFKPEDCNPKTETFKNCHCNCNINAAHCNSTWQTFNGHTCNCDCKYVQQCDIDKEWDPLTCQCRCLKCLRDLCIKANLQINEETCQCAGQVVSRRSSLPFRKNKSLFYSNKKSMLFRKKNY